MTFITPNWPAPQSIKSYSTTRQGGYSQSCYSSFNLGIDIGDNPEAVLKNRELLKTELNLPKDPQWLQQVHGTSIVQLSQKNAKIFSFCADASFTNQKNQVCIVQTADCLPVLICNKSGTLVSAIHAGWRGLEAGIIEKTISLLSEERTSLLAWLGPAIGPEVFEVGDEVRDLFLKKEEQTAAAFKATPHKGKWIANIYQLATLQLLKCGVTSIYGGTYCTYSQRDLFYSYRRDQGLTGRMATLIWIS